MLMMLNEIRVECSAVIYGCPQALFKKPIRGRDGTWLAHNTDLLALTLFDGRNASIARQRSTILRLQHALCVDVVSILHMIIAGPTLLFVVKYLLLAQIDLTSIYIRIDTYIVFVELKGVRHGLEHNVMQCDLDLARIGIQHCGVTWICMHTTTRRVKKRILINLFQSHL